jgi:uncharacterized protein (DUF2345 family)
MTAASNLTLAATSGDLAQTAGGALSASAVDDLSLSAGGALRLASEGKTVVRSGDDLDVYSSNAMRILSYSNAQFTSTDGDMLISAPNGTLTLDAANINLGAGGGGLISQEDVNIASIGSNVKIAAGQDFWVRAARNVDMAASNQYVAASGGDFSVSSVSSNVLLDAARDVAMTAGNDLVMAADRDINRFSARDILDAASNDIRFSASNDIVAAASRAFTATTAGGDIQLASGAALTATAASNVAIRSLQRHVEVEARSNMSLTAGGQLAMESAGAMEIDASAMTIKTASGNMVIGANETAKQVFQIGGVDVIEVFKTEYHSAGGESNVTNYTVKVNADFEIAGGVNSVGVNETILKVQDRAVHLSHNPDAEFPYDGPANNRSGIIVDGVPETWVMQGATASGIPAERFEKSFTWNTPSGDGTRRLGDGVVDNEAYWELRGGHLKLTHVDEATGAQVSFGFRIGNTKELELYKYDSSTGRTHRVSRFGRVF